MPCQNPLPSFEPQQTKTLALAIRQRLVLTGVYSSGFEQRSLFSLPALYLVLLACHMLCIGKRGKMLNVEPPSSDDQRVAGNVADAVGTLLVEEDLEQRCARSRYIRSRSPHLRCKVTVWLFMQPKWRVKVQLIANLNWRLVRQENKQVATSKWQSQHSNRSI